MKILIVNGPNLNMLGVRESAIYGTQSYEALCAYIEGVCAEEGVEAEIFQSNHEGALVDRIQAAFGKEDAIVINSAAYTHTSVAILDALRAVALPAIEVHLSDPQKREEFRRVSYPALACEKTIAGLGFESYGEAIRTLARRRAES